MIGKPLLENLLKLQVITCSSAMLHKHVTYRDDIKQEIELTSHIRSQMLRPLQSQQLGQHAAVVFLVLGNETCGFADPPVS